LNQTPPKKHGSKARIVQSYITFRTGFMKSNLHMKIGNKALHTRHTPPFSLLPFQNHQIDSGPIMSSRPNNPPLSEQYGEGGKE
jgi:hypothetical protein